MWMIGSNCILDWFWIEGRNSSIARLSTGRDKLFHTIKQKLKYRCCVNPCMYYKKMRFKNRSWEIGLDEKWSRIPLVSYTYSRVDW
jgi:hypothetical protein